MRVSCCSFGRTPTESEAPRTHRPRRDTAWNALVRLSDRGMGTSITRRAGSGWDELPASSPSTTMQRPAACAGAHAPEEPVHFGSLAIGDGPKILFHERHDTGCVEKNQALSSQNRLEPHSGTCYNPSTCPAEGGACRLCKTCGHCAKPSV